MVKNSSATPMRKKKSNVPLRGKSSEKTNYYPPVLTVYAFPSPFAFEAYIYSRGNQFNNDEDDVYLKKFEICMNPNPDDPNQQPCPYLDEANFVKIVYRRKPNSDNDHLVGVKKPYWRQIMIRYPKEGDSTPETRQEGLEVLKKFMTDPDHTNYPPNEIVLRDATDEDNYMPLDHFFLDWDIKKFMVEDIPEEDMNNEFYEKFRDFADKCWAGKFKSEFAYKLGFPKEE